MTRLNQAIAIYDIVMRGQTNGSFGNIPLATVARQIRENMAASEIFRLRNQ